VKLQSSRNRDVNAETPLRRDVNAETPLRRDVNVETPMCRDVNVETPLRRDVDARISLAGVIRMPHPQFIGGRAGCLTLSSWAGMRIGIAWQIRLLLRWK